MQWRRPKQSLLGAGVAWDTVFVIIAVIFGLAVIPAVKLFLAIG
jgi:hypothetical protein